MDLMDSMNNFIFKWFLSSWSFIQTKCELSRFFYGGFICAALLERVLSSVARRLSFSSRLFVLCSFLTQKQHRPFLKAISMPIVRVVILCMACLSVGKIISVKLFSSKLGKRELTWLPGWIFPLVLSLHLIGTSTDHESLQIRQVWPSWACRCFSMALCAGHNTTALICC